MIWELGKDPRSRRCKAMTLSDWTPTTKGMRSIAVAFGEVVERLDFSGCEISDELLKILCACLFAVKTLNFSDCPMLRNQAMSLVVGGCGRTLEVLDLTRCYNIDDVGLMYIGGQIGHDSIACAKLRTISVEECTRITTRGLIALGKGCPSLAQVNFSGCVNVTDDGIEGLQKDAESCRLSI